MSGAIAFIKGLLGLGVATGVNVGQSVSLKKKDAEVAAAYGWDATGETRQMRERVRREWWDICGKTYNACDKPARAYGNPYKIPWCYCKKRWFIAHLNEKGIPYDDVVVNDVTGVTFYERQNQWSREAMRKL